MKSLSDINIEKSRSGVYKDTSENRRLHRVGQRYGSPAREEDLASKPLGIRGSDIADLKRNKGDVKAEPVSVENVKPGDRVYDWEFYDYSKRKLYAGAKPSGTVTKVEPYKNGFGDVVGAYITFDDGQRTLHRGAFIVERGESKKPSKVKIDGKTFRVQDGKIVASMYDTQSRISKLNKFAKENGYEVKFEESSGKKETGSKHSMSGHLTVNDFDKVKNGGHVMFVKNGERAFNTVTRVGENWMSETPDGEKKVISSQELYDLVQQYDNKDGYGINARLSFSGPLDEDSKKQSGEKFSRVNLPDIPNAHKVNLTKYLSAKRKKAVDDAWEKAKFDSLTREKAGVFQEGYNKLREQFNNNFDSMSKSERAELLYKILKMKNAMERK